MLTYNATEHPEGENAREQSREDIPLIATLGSGCTVLYGNWYE